MILHFQASIISQSFLRFSLNHFVNKISCFNRPTLGNFSFFYLNLFWQYMFPYFFSRFSYIRSSSIHAFISHYTGCKVINSNSVILSAHNLRSYSWINKKKPNPYSLVSQRCLGNSQDAIPWQYQNLLFEGNLLWQLLVKNDRWWIRNSLPSSSSTRFSGFISRWSIFLLWTYSRPATKQAMKNPIWL